jgi:hypothetical protein
MATNTNVYVDGTAKRAMDVLMADQPNTHVTLFDADDTQPDYIGQHTVRTAATSDPNWQIQKFTYSGSAITKIEKVNGAWDDRASLFP